MNNKFIKFFESYFISCCYDFKFDSLKIIIYLPNSNMTYGSNFNISNLSYPNSNVKNVYKKLKYAFVGVPKYNFKFDFKNLKLIVYYQCNNYLYQQIIELILFDNSKIHKQCYIEFKHKLHKNLNSINKLKKYEIYITRFLIFICFCFIFIKVFLN